MKKVNHENILKFYELVESGKFYSEAKNKEVAYGVLEPALGGELFDFLQCSNEQNENLNKFLCRKIFKSL